jgi:uncharacterized membrane protein YfcA
VTGVAQDALIIGAAVIGGALNSVAGGGSFFTFPALVLGGLAPIAANATSTVALWPGSLASTWAYRHDVDHMRRQLIQLTIASILGGLLGARLLLWTRNETFAHIVPWLLLTATTLFAVSGRAVAYFRARNAGALHPGLLIGGQFVIAIYGGYFGGGMGILMLATYALAGLTDIHAMNGLKSLLGAAINGAAVASFVVAGIVEWRPAILMVAGSLAGGYFGARLAKRVDASRVRQLVIATGAVMTLKFFLSAP